MLPEIVRRDRPFAEFQRIRWITSAFAAVYFAINVTHVDADENPVLRLDRSDTSVEVWCGERPLLNYRYGQVPYKPYIDRFYSPSGRNVLRDNVPDHAHHHGLMFAIAVDGVDFWAEFPDQAPGTQRQQELQLHSAAAPGTLGTATIQQRLDWTTTQGQSLMVEERTITVYDPQPLKASLLTWQSNLAPATDRAEITLGGSHYFGLGMRFLASMDQVGTFFNSQQAPGEVVRGEERLVRATWCAFHGPAAEGPVTVAVFDHPGNPRHPATHFLMRAPFAYLSATLNLWEEPLQVPAGSPLRLCYGVAIWDGEVAGDQVEALYQRWIDLVQPTAAHE